MKHFLAALALALSPCAAAAVGITAVALGPLDDTPTTGSFDLNETYLGIDQLTLTFDPCEFSIDGCTDTLGTSEEVLVTLVGEVFSLGTGTGLGDPVSTNISPSAALEAELLDGQIDFSITLDADGMFTPGVLFSVLSLSVIPGIGEPAPVPLPASLPLLMAGLAGFGLLRRRARRL